MEAWLLAWSKSQDPPSPKSQTLWALLPNIAMYGNEHELGSSPRRFSSLANALFPENTLLTHKLVVKNPHHASYSKSRWGLALVEACIA